MNWLLMYLMSGGIDRPINRWEEMFLPMELERNVAGLSYVDPQGRERSLVSGQETWFQAADRAPVPERPPSYVLPALGLGALLGLGAAALGLWRAGKREGEPRVFRRLRGPLGLAIGLIGAILAYMSLFTDHTVTYGNRNLFLANPLHLAVVPLAVAVAAGTRAAGRWLTGCGACWPRWPWFPLRCRPSPRCVRTTGWPWRCCCPSSWAAPRPAGWRSSKRGKAWRSRN